MNFGHVNIVNCQARVCQRTADGAFRPLERGQITARHRQQVVDLQARAHFDGLREAGGHIISHQNQRRCAVRDQRAIRHFQRIRDHRVLLALGGAEFNRQWLVQLGQRVVHRVGVVLGGNHRHGLRGIAPLFGIGTCKACENGRKGQARFLLLI